MARASLIGQCDSDLLQVQAVQLKHEDRIDPRLRSRALIRGSCSAQAGRVAASTSRKVAGVPFGFGMGPGRGKPGARICAHVAGVQDALGSGRLGRLDGGTVRCGVGRARDLADAGDGDPEEFQADSGTRWTTTWAHCSHPALTILSLWRGSRLADVAVPAYCQRREDGAIRVRVGRRGGTGRLRRCR